MTRSRKRTSVVRWSGIRRQRLLRLAAWALLIAVSWTCVGVFVASQHPASPLREKAQDHHERMVQTAAAMIAWALLTPFVIHVANRFPLRRPHSVRNAAIVAAIAIAFSTIIAIFDALVPRRAEPQNVDIEELRSVVFALFHVELMLFLSIVAITNFVRIRAEADVRQMREAQSESQLVEARLRRLRGDLQPHFLFNTLNAVATLIHTDSTAARATIATLLDLLRRTFELTRTEVPLGEELDFAGRYLELQKIRFGDRLEVSIDVSDPALLGAAVPPLLLQPLIENSVIHGISKLPSGGAIGVRVFRDEHALRLEVRDNGPGCDPQTPFRIGSLGVPNTRARLEYLYQDADALSFTHDKGEFIASVRIPLRVV